MTLRFERDSSTGNRVSLPVQIAQTMLALLNRERLETALVQVLSPHRPVRDVPSHAGRHLSFFARPKNKLPMISHKKLAATLFRAQGRLSDLPVNAGGIRIDGVSNHCPQSQEYPSKGGTHVCFLP